MERCSVATLKLDSSAGRGHPKLAATNALANRVAWGSYEQHNCLKKTFSGTKEMYISMYRRRPFKEPEHMISWKQQRCKYVFILY